MTPAEVHAKRLAQPSNKALREALSKFYRGHKSPSARAVLVRMRVQRTIWFGAEDERLRERLDKELR